MIYFRKMQNDFTHFSDKWADITDLTNRWIKRFPLDYKDNMKWVKMNRDEFEMNQNMGGKHKDRPLRKGLLMHPSLILYIQQFHPTFMEEPGDVREFAKRHRQFVVDSGVLPAKK